MEQLKDLLNNIKDRFTNPLFFSFVFSWLLINWTIPISLLWYDTKQIEKAGFSSIYELILCQLSMKDGLYYPILMALGYTLLAPILKNLIRLFYTFINQLGEKLNLKISEGASIPFEKYIKLRESYSERSKLLENIIKTENIHNTQFEKQKDELLKVQTQNLTLEKELADTRKHFVQLTDVSFLNGYWTHNFSNSTSSTSGQEQLYFENGKCFIINGTGRTHAFNISNFYCDAKQKRLFFIKERLDIEKDVAVPTGIITKFNSVSLRIEHETYLAGTENGIIQVYYTKQSNF